MNFLRNSCRFLFLLAIIYQISPAQEQSLDRTLSQLRGTWEYHTYYKKWKVNFLSDQRMIINKSDATYKLTSRSIIITVEGKETSYNYLLDGKTLSLSDPNGNTIHYAHRDAGESEQQIDGIFYNEMDPTQTSFLTFKEGKYFSLRDTANVILYGMYRVKNNIVVVVFDDGAIENVTIRYRDDNDIPDGVVFQDQIFSKERPVTIVDYLPPLTTYIPPPPCYPYPCPPPPCLSCGNPPPPPDPPAPMPPPSQHIDPPPPPVHHGDRVIGTTRGDETPGAAGTSTRAGGGRRP